MPGHADSALESHAAQAAAMLRLLANERRLLLLCHLMAAGEATVGRLARLVGLSQPALSQHLTRLREDGLVAARKQGTEVHYRIVDPRVAQLIEALRGMYCPSPSS